MSDNNIHLEDLFKEDIYILNSNSTPKKDSNENKIGEVEKSIVNIDDSSFDESKIYIFSDYEISKPEKQFLAKILKAVKVDLHSIKVAEWNTNAKEFTGENFVFNSQITECGLTGKRISAPPLHIIEQNIELKRSLWANMQKLFLHTKI